MATTRQLSFSGGEISPSLYARVDLVKYTTGLRTCLNHMVMRHGGTANRPGTGFVGEVADSAKTVRLIPFIFNPSQTYVLEFGDTYMRVHRNGAQVTEVPINITNITQANPAVVTLSSYLISSFATSVYDGSATGPSGISIAPDGTLWVCDSTTDKIYNITTTGTPISSFATSAFDAGATQPNGIVIASDGTLWICDAVTNKIYNVQTDGTLISSFATSVYDASATGPSGMSYAPNNTLWVCDGVTDKIYNIQTDGTLISSFATSVYDASATQPEDVSIAPDGTLWICDSATDKIYNVQADGTLINSFNTSTFDASATAPNGISFAPDGTLWICDIATDKIYNSHRGFSTGDEVFISGVGGMTELNGRNFKIVVITETTFSLQFMDISAVDSTGFGAYTSGGTFARIFSLNTPYTEAVLPDLRFIQSADVVTLTHPSFVPQELKRTGHTAWTLTAITFGPLIGTPTGLASDAAGSAEFYKVTAVDAESGEESLPSTSIGSSTQTSTLTWDAVTGAGNYNVYRLTNGVYGWIGLAGAPSFTDNSFEADALDEPPIDRQPFAVAGDYPSACTYFQQRLIFANTDNNTEGVWASRSALPKNFMVSTPLQDDDAVTFSIVGRQVNEVHHLLDLGKLLMFTESGEWVVDGDSAGILTPSGINPRQHTANGSGALAPIVVNGTALYVQARGSIIRDLGFDFASDGYRGNELTIFSAHLFDDYTLTDWDYQQIPHSIVWVVRNDGTLLGLTYVREHQVFAWHRHEFTGGTVENVAVVPEGSENVLYVVVKRTIDGRVTRYVEYMKTRQIIDIRDAVFMDSSLTFDGRNTEATTMTLSGGTTWGHDEDLTLTASVANFVSTDIGNERWLTGSDGTVIRCEITDFTSTTVVTVRPNKTVPIVLRAMAVTDWSAAVDTVAGLWHLEGENVSILADGFVSASPNNTKYIKKTVANGSVTLDKPGAVIHVGLPITADVKTLNIDTVQGQSLADKKKHVSKLTLFVENSRGILAGPDADNLNDLKIRRDEGYDDPIELATGTVEVNIAADWNSTGAVLIRQIDPLPLSILAVVPAGYLAR